MQPPSRSSPASDVTLVYFSCKGREHLLLKTAEAFEKYNTFPLHERILAFDGALDPGFPVADLGIDRLLNNVKRAGYVPSIGNVLPLVRTPYIFWQEDDCRFLRPFDVDYLRREMEANPDWVQVGWGIGEKFPDHEKVSPLGREGMYRTAFGYTMRPALCRTADLREVFGQQQEPDLDRNQYLETYIRDWLKLKAKVSVSIDPGEESMYAHEGILETTNGDSHHMESSREKLTQEKYVSVFGHGSLPPLWRRAKNLLDLLGSGVRMALSQFYSLRRYEVAWRVVRIERETRK